MLRPKFAITAALLSLVFGLFDLNAVAAIREIAALEEVREIADEMAAELGSRKVLVVFDIDNTLLATSQDLGSDQWFEWQKEMIISGEESTAVAQSIEGLLAVQAKIYALSAMRPTRANNADIVRELQNSGMSVMALTARGPVNRDATLRELSHNGIDMTVTALAPVRGLPGRYLPVNPLLPQLSGLTDAEIARYRLKTPRRVSYEHGVMMVAGQHKGAMLRTLLHSTGAEPGVVIFVDDKHSNVEAVDEALTAIGLRVLSLRYGGEDAVVAQFNNGDKGAVTSAWQQLHHAIQSVFGNEATF